MIIIHEQGQCNKLSYRQESQSITYRDEVIRPLVVEPSFLIFVQSYAV